MSDTPKGFDPYDYIEPCEPDCSPERHAYHQGQWDMAGRIEAALEPKKGIVIADTVSGSAEYTDAMLKGLLRREKEDARESNSDMWPERGTWHRETAKPSIESRPLPAPSNMKRGGDYE